MFREIIPNFIIDVLFAIVETHYFQILLCLCFDVRAITLNGVHSVVIGLGLQEICDGAACLAICEGNIIDLSSDSGCSCRSP